MNLETTLILALHITFRSGTLRHHTNTVTIIPAPPPLPAPHTPPFRAPEPRPPENRTSKIEVMLYLMLTTRTKLSCPRFFKGQTETFVSDRDVFAIPVLQSTALYIQRSIFLLLGWFLCSDVSMLETHREAKF